MTFDKEAATRWTRLSVLGRVVFAVLGCGLLASVLGPGRADAAQLPSGFSDTAVLTGLTQPTTVQFSPDGRIFVAEKSGLIKVFDNLSDTTPTIFADLSTQVYNYWDRGLLGLALDPNFPATPYVYVHYTRDAVLGGSAPRWGSPGVLSDPCPTPPGPLSDGCVASGRLSRLQANGDVMTGSEQVLIDDWCQQFPSHSVGAIAFGADGALYTSGGDGASWTFEDWGQAGQPKNPCGDPPSGSGTALSPPTAQGGALRSQDMTTPSDPGGLDGTIIRVDPATGDALSSNPRAFDSDPNVRRTIAYGLRNPFRLTVKPGTNEIYAGDVGYNTWEEINVATPSAVRNFGWPCYEGFERQVAYDAANLNVCETLYGQPGAVTSPLVTYAHTTTNDACAPGSSSISGLAFYGSGSYPSRYNGALFYLDYSRNCMWALIGGVASGLENFGTQLSHPVDLKTGPGGDLFYVDFDSGTLHRITYSSGGGGGGGTSPTTYLSDLTPVSATNGWGPYERDRSNGEQAAGDGHTLILNGTPYARGLGVHAASDIGYTVPTGCTTFTAAVGIDDEVGSNGNVVFQALVNGTVQFDSGAMTGATATKTVSVPVSAGATLRLLVATNGSADFDHADWADAKLTCTTSGGGNQPPQVTTPAAQSNTVGQTVSLQVVGSDPDSGQTLTWSTTGLPGGLSINTSSGLISGTIATGAQTGSPYTVTVTAKDNGTPQQTTSKQFTWTIASSGGGGGGGSSSTTYLSDLTPVSAMNGWGPYERDKSNGEQAAGDGHTLTLNGTPYARGLGVHAASDIRYTVPSGCTTFTAAVGVDDETGANGDVIFRVYTGSTLQYDSGAMTGATATKTLSVPVSAGATLRLYVDTDGIDAYDHADWADAKLTCTTSGSGNQPPQVTTPAAQSNTVGQTVSLQVVGSDPDAGQTLTWSTTGLPGGLSINTGSGLISGTIATGAQTGSPYTVTVTAKDNGTPQQTTSKQFTWTITAGTGTGLGFAAPTSIATGAQTHSVLAVDVDGDGDRDLVAAVSNANLVSVSRNNGSGTFAAPTTYTTGTGTSPKFADVADINGDGKVDVATANQDSSTVSVLLGNGNGTFGSATSYPSCPNAHEVAIGDVNGDAKGDVVAACWGSNVVSVLLNTGTGALAAKVDYTAAAAPHSLVLRDFDGDGDLDMAVACLNGNTVAVLKNNGPGTFGAPTLNSVPQPHNVRTADVNGDGRLDLVATSQSSNSVVVMLGNGNGTFAAGVSYSVGVVPKASAIGDLNGDGKLDIAVANTSNNYPSGSAPTSFTVLLGDGIGGFTQGAVIADDLTPFSVAIADLNGDGKNDIATANWHSGDVKIFRHT